MAKRGRPKGSKNKKKFRAFESRTVKYTPTWICYTLADTFWFKVIKGIKNFLKSPFKK